MTGSRPRPASQEGFAYLTVLIALVIIGLAAAGSVQMGAVLQRRAAEEELLEIGGEFRAALESYALATPAGLPRTPKTLQDLLRDPRYPAPRRHLRKVYFDPMTGRQNWGLVMALDGSGIVGIHSLSTARPIKIGNFPPAYQSFQDKTSYTEWVFVQTSAVPSTPPSAPGRQLPSGPDAVSAMPSPGPK